MVRWIVLLLSLSLTACGSNAYKVADAEYRQRVKTLGVLPLLVDDASVIVHPDREGVLAALRVHNRDKERRLIEILKEKKIHFDVRPVAGLPAGLLDRLVAGRSLQGESAASRLAYRFDPAQAAELVRRNVVDALLVVVQHGVVRQEKRWGRMRLNFLAADYNQIVVTAAIVDAAGEVLWEYASAPGEPFLHLQYPDFDEACYNKSDTVRVKFITVDGLDRTLSETGNNLFERSPYPRPYRDLFRDIDAALDPGLRLPVVGAPEK